MPVPNNGVVPDQTGKLAIVTGSTSGIGFETAKQLALTGAEVVLAVRNPAKGQDAVARILAAAPRSKVSQRTLDLAILSSVREFADHTRRIGRPVDILVNNAGIMAIPRRTLTPDGFETQFATNFLGHFALSALLVDLLRAAKTPRVVSLGSLAARFPGTAIYWEDLHLEKKYSGMRAYQQSKLANLLFARELGRRSEAQGWGIVSTAAHPGSTFTNLQTTGKRFEQANTRRPIDATTLIMRIPGMSQCAEMGALPVLKAATDPAARSGDYFGPSRHFEVVGPPKQVRMPRAAEDPQAGHRLWVTAEELVGVHWPETSAAQ